MYQSSRGTDKKGPCPLPKFEAKLGTCKERRNGALDKQNATTTLTLLTLVTVVIKRLKSQARIWEKERMVSFTRLRIVRRMRLLL